MSRIYFNFFHCFCIVSNRSYSFPVTIASRRNEYDYLLHILVASGSRVILMKVLHVNDWIAHLTIGLLAGIIIPILIYQYIKNTKLKYLFSL